MYYKIAVKYNLTYSISNKVHQNTWYNTDNFYEKNIMPIIIIIIMKE